MTVVDYRHWRDVPRRAWRWENFTPAELASRGDGSLRVVPAAFDALQFARDAAGKPFVINSAYRDPVHNARVGGAPLSRHKFGDAFDISLKGHDRYQLFVSCRAAGFKGFGFYQTFLHIDLGRERQWFGGSISRQLWKALGD